MSKHYKYTRDEIARFITDHPDISSTTGRFLFDLLFKKETKKKCEHKRRNTTVVFEGENKVSEFTQCQDCHKEKYNLSKNKKVLLLVSKNDNLYRLFEDNTWDSYCSGELKTSPQPEIEQMKKLDSERELVEIDKLNLDEYIENFDPLEIPSRTIGIEIMVEKKINEIIDHLNSIKKDRHSDIRKVNELSKKK